MNLKKYSDLDRLLVGLRRDYKFGVISDGSLNPDPLVQFAKWFDDAVEKKVSCLNAMSVATANKKGMPSVRILLLKGFSSKGFVFFSNYASHKGRDMRENPNAEALLYWPEVERQIRITGCLKKIPREKSAAYFSKRPRAAQLGAWVSRQSQPVENREALESKLAEIEKKFSGKKVPLPPDWGGFLLVPSSYEFWQGRANRLNDRILYKKTAGSWKQIRLQP